MNIFSTGWKIMNWHFLEYLNLADFKSAFRFVVSFLGPFRVGLKWPKTTKYGQNGPTPEGCKFWSKEDTKKSKYRFEISEVQMF